ncbi:hypothetical protein EHQ53_10080 [Leptospira langatensis]|uniref:Porin n=1 Tax=Leptospira langatensis TaxID=2484983 RepID=A0A5F1ZVB8_9LEPT|nr:hypothetical protein [Leptospira langatensis]TGK00220.1 hypothetical protein EHO57_13115 [Leptospira langatensis]TGL41148.1 hypothetical protein EHQ53_10080 [Leptospira langatensis]
MKRAIVLLFLFSNILEAQSLPTPFSSGFSFSGFDSRFYQTRQETLWVRGEFCLKEARILFSKQECAKHKAFLEKRGETVLGSYSFENERIYASYGNRFRPLNHFFFLRETFDFTSFWFLEQPTVRAGFLSLKLGESQVGTYYAERSAEKRPGLFFKPYKNYLEFAYSPETKEAFILAEYPSSSERKEEKKQYGFRMEVYGTKENPQGIVSASWQDWEKSRRVFFSGYKGRAGQLFNLTEKTAPEEKAGLFRFVWEPGNYHRLQIAGFERISAEGKTIYSARAITTRIGFLQFPIFALVAQIRAYEFSDQPDWILGRGLYLAYQKRAWRWEIGQEWRDNGDRLTEAGLQISLGKEWKIYSSLLYAEEGNRTPSFAEESITPDETGLVVTDKAFYSFLRIFHPYFAIHLRHTRGKSASGDSLSLRFQVFLPIWE